MPGSRIFAVGDHVHVMSIGKGVVLEVRSGGRYLVEVKARRMLVNGVQLSALVEARRRVTTPTVPRAEPPQESTTRSHVPESIDLHGMTVVEAVAALDAFLNEAILAGHSELRVIHGRSGGRLKAAVHERLRAVTSVRAFRVDPANLGVTVIRL